MPINWVFGGTDIGIGVLLILVCLPLRQRLIPMNYWYGFRIAQAFAAEENWYRINEYGADRLIRWSAALIAAGFVICCLPPIHPRDVTGMLLASLPPLLAVVPPLIEVYIFAGKLSS